MIKPINNNVLVSHDTKTITKNDFVIEDEVKGEGVILKCKVLEIPDDNDFEFSKKHPLKKGDFVYIPQYALREISEGIYACSFESIIAVECD